MALICPYCSRQTELIWVHGHGQCAHCNINIDECCRGETLQPDCPTQSRS